MKEGQIINDDNTFQWKLVLKKYFTCLCCKILKCVSYAKLRNDQLRPGLQDIKW